jgi:hypothetical protein
VSACICTPLKCFMECAACGGPSRKTPCLAGREPELLFKKDVPLAVEQFAERWHECYQIGNAIVCDGRGKTTRRHAPCPWCCVAVEGVYPKPWPLMLITEIHSGYCAPDYVCGRCGQDGNYEEEKLRRVPDARREENKKRVRLFGAAR